MVTMEEPVELAHAIGRHGRADTLIVADCLTFWLTARLMAPGGVDVAAAWGDTAPVEGALRACAGPLVLISNEVNAAGLTPGQDAREFLASLGAMNQQAAAACERVTLMSSGAALVLKGSS